jgi:hypothetical protein
MNVSLSATQEKVLHALENGRKLYSTRMEGSTSQFGCDQASISTIKALLRKGYIEALPEKKNGPFYQTRYISTRVHTEKRATTIIETCRVCGRLIRVISPGALATCDVKTCCGQVAHSQQTTRTGEDLEKLIQSIKDQQPA